MKTFKTINVATTETLSKIRKMNEVMNGKSNITIDGVDLIETLRPLHENRPNRIQTISNDFSTITINHLDDCDLSDYENNLITETPIHCYIGGDFTATEMVTKKIKVRRGNGYFLREATQPTIVKHNVIYSKYIVTNVEDGIVTLEATQ